MQRLRKRPRIDAIINQQRASTASWSRRFYMLLLAGLGLSIGNYLFADMFVLRAEGIVLADHDVVAATYQGRVADVRVREGQTIHKGDLLARLESPDMLRDLADLSARNADLDQRLAQLKVRSQQISLLLPLAERRANENTQVVAKIDNLSTKGLVIATRLDEALSSRFDSASQFAELSGEMGLLP
jgi:multidrug resistance efflux pump